ncbi:MAG TPA: cellulase family glycosylhydrolase [Solirubrobacteraceae bacterium]|jgi:hypothetical protein|nr:cellulase family glycosylhydrolase [Solirubrobacteraceae bacterium]
MARALRVTGSIRTRVAAIAAIGLLAPACAAHLVLAASSRSASPPLASAPLAGINVAGPGGRSASSIEGEMRSARALGVKLVRFEVPWSQIEGNGPGQIDAGALASMDRIVDDAAGDGIGVIMLVDSTPCWASSAPETVRRGCQDPAGAASRWQPSDPATAARFFAFLAQRYKSQLAALEVWNEPDQINELYFAGPEKAVHYAALLRAAYTAIKQVDPTVPVLGGSLVGSDGVFLRALYAAGIKGYYDGLAVHFYSLTLAALREFREVELANGDSSRLWLDEFGFPTCWPRHSVEQEITCVTQPVQAADLTSVFQSLSRTPYVAAVLPFKLADSPGEDFGVLRQSGAPKRSFAALRRVFASPFGRPQAVSLHLGTQRGRVLASGSGPVGDYMRLEAFRGTTLRYRATFTLDRFNRYRLTLPAALGTRGLRVRVYQAWAGPGRAAQKRL